MNDRRRKAVFLDRDGTLVRDVDYLTDPAELELLPGVPEALRELRGAGFLLLVVTNQSAVARGWLTEPELEHINRELNRLLARQRAAIDAFYHCPHLPEGTVQRYAIDCPCRKPRPGLLQRAAREWDVALGNSYMVGDSERDVEAGRRAGCKTVYLGTGCGVEADAEAAGLLAASRFILGDEQQG
jgi:D-glycero-D-manno-heptose 1,7-bisphosphate phosphatase